MRPDDLDPDTGPGLKPLPASHERPEQQVAERAVLEQERSQLLALDGDVRSGSVTTADRNTV